MTRRLRGWIGAAMAAAGAAAAVAVALTLKGDDDPRHGGPPDSRAAVAALARGAALVTTHLDGTETSAGSGFVIDARAGLIVTAAHVVNYQPRPGRFAVRVRARGRTRRAVVVGVAPCEDVALLRVRDVHDLKALPLGRGRDVRDGDTVVAGGYPTAAPRARNLVTRQTRVIATRAQALRGFGPAAVPLRDALQVEGAVSTGTSGGPLVDLNGRVVGLAALRGSRTGDRSTYAVEVDRLRTVTGQLRHGERHTWLGKSFGYLWRPGAGQRQAIVLTADLSAFAGPRRGGAFLVRSVDGRPAGGTTSAYCRTFQAAARDGRAVVRLRRARVSRDGTYRGLPAAPKNDVMLRVRAKRP